jgi:hypothetical protein
MQTSVTAPPSDIGDDRFRSGTQTQPCQQAGEQLASDVCHSVTHAAARLCRLTAMWLKADTCTPAPAIADCWGRTCDDRCACWLPVAPAANSRVAAVPLAPIAANASFVRAQVRPAICQ